MGSPHLVCGASFPSREGPHDRKKWIENRLERFSLGNYLLLVDDTGRLFREGKATVSRELAEILDRLGSNAENREARRRSWGPAGRWTGSSRPAESFCDR